MRGVVVAFLLMLAGVLSVLSNVGLWVDRTVYDTDTFVATTDDVLDDEDVQQVLAERFAAQLFVAADIEARLQTELPEGLKFLALPLSTAAREFLREAALRLLERQPFESVRNEALQQAHTRLLDAIEGRSGTLRAENGALVLDLRPVLERVAQDVTGEDVNLPQQGGAEQQVPQDLLDQLPPAVRERLQRDQQNGLLSRLELPEDAGQFVIEDASIAWAYRIARYGNDVVYLILGVTVACYAAAVVAARDKRSGVRAAAITLAVAGVVSLALLLPLGQAARTFARNDAAATSVLDIVTGGYREQSLAMILGGASIAAVATLVGSSRTAVAVRSVFSGHSAGGPSLTDIARERVSALRIYGFVGAALVLMLTADPSARTYVTTLGLLGLYLVALSVLTSDAPIAGRIRDYLKRLFENGPTDAPSEDTQPRSFIRSWVSTHASWMRFAGLCVALVLLLLWPGLNMRVFVMVVALALVYFALIDLAANQPGDTGDHSG